MHIDYQADICCTFSFPALFVSVTADNKSEVLDFCKGRMLTSDSLRKGYSQLGQELRRHPEDRLGLVVPGKTRQDELFSLYILGQSYCGSL